MIILKAARAERMEFSYKIAFFTVLATITHSEFAFFSYRTTTI